MHKFLKFIFGIELYMFRTGFLSIISTVYTAIGIYHTGFASGIRMEHPDPASKQPA